MNRKQRLICLLLVFLMVAALAACGKGNEPSKPSDAGQASGQEQPAGNDASQTGKNEKSGGDASGGQTAQPARLTGKLDLIRLDDRDPSILRGVRILGNLVGTQDDINGKESSLDDVRCIFELNEWIEFYPDIDAEYDLRVWVLRHRDDQAYYNTCEFSDLMPNFVSCCDLHDPVDEDHPDEYPWGSFYLHPEECEPGYYDFVFTCEGKAIAVLQTRFYGEVELSDKSGAELEALMHE